MSLRVVMIQYGRLQDIHDYLAPQSFLLRVKTFDCIYYLKIFPLGEWYSCRGLALVANIFPWANKYSLSLSLNSGV